MISAGLSLYFNSNRWVKLFFLPMMKLAGRNTREGAATALYAALEPSVETDSKFHGAYLNQYGSIAEPCVQARDIEACEKVWTESEKEFDL